MGSRGIVLLFHDLGTRWGSVVSVMPQSPLPPRKTRYPLYKRLGGPQDRSGQVRKISSPPGFDPQTVQLVASRYTDCAIPAPVESNGRHKRQAAERIRERMKKCQLCGYTPALPTVTRFAYNL